MILAKDVMDQSLKPELLSAIKMDHPLKALLQKPLQKILAFDALEECYQMAQKASGATFAEKIVNALQVKIRLSEQDLIHIPVKGGCIVVANHPYGGIEGIILATIISNLRRDVKIMANHYLSLIPELRDFFIFVDPFARTDSIMRNIRPMRQALEWLKGGGLLVIFPAGAVSYFQFREGQVSDPAWQENVGRLIEKAKVPVIPVYFRGCNKLPFQTMGLFHPVFRTLRLPTEFVNKRNGTFDLSIGKAISAQKLSSYGTTIDKLNYLRKRTYNLAHRSNREDLKTLVSNKLFREIPDPQNKKDLLEDIRHLPARQVLFEQNGQQVFYAWAYQIPRLLKEIGRLREITFREVGEGTGKALDLDQFDEYYAHLIAWDGRQEELIGAYRLGLTDIILREFGKRGLYTNTLFKIKKTAFRNTSPAIELGRSFIVSAYQRSFNSLFLLWRGIGEFIARHPYYRFLFGPVSISSAYHDASQGMLIEYLIENHRHSELAGAFHPRNFKNSQFDRKPFKKRGSLQLAELEDMIGDIESNGLGIPILIKQYLKLGAQFVAFNLDPDFNNAIDGLIMVDLLRTDEKILSRYMGNESACHFRTYQMSMNKIKSTLFHKNVLQ
jgi:putative hemolysin